MKSRNRVFGFLVGISMLAFLMVSCATVPELKALYRLPPSSNQLGGHEVFFSLDDARGSKDILKEGARNEFKHFPGNIIYSIARYKEAGFRLGPYELTDMIKDAFNRRFENMGLKVLHTAETGKPELKIVLQKFTLGFAKRDWVAKMRYEARLIKDGRVLATQDISGETEQYKIVGTKGADQAIGGLLTDAVNRLDVAKLLEQARLL
ncbi:MAG: hypothetical protein WAL98_12990 [Desulfatiglandaceae bacterium]|jgi:hypothetical protein